MSDVHLFDDQQLQQHLALAETLMPGPDYYTVLRWVHEILRPASYVEIGIRNGDSIRLALDETRCIGIDPAPNVQALPENTRVFPATSDEFFAREHLPGLLTTNTFSLAFIDGLHLFEQALRDFINLEKLASPRSIILLHDCLPLDAVTAERTRTTHFYSGDVWKLTMCLRVHRSDLKMTMIRTGPTGLCVVGNLNSSSTDLTSNYSRYVDEFIGLSYEDLQSRQHDMPVTIDNTRDEVDKAIADLLAR
jgi:hypothetical protein